MLLFREVALFSFHHLYEAGGVGKELVCLVCCFGFKAFDFAIQVFCFLFRNYLVVVFYRQSPYQDFSNPESQVPVLMTRI